MTWVTWILYPFLIIGTSIQFASAGTRYNYHQHLIHLTQAIFAFDTFPRWKKLFKPSKPSLTTLLPKNCFPLCPNHSKANTHTPAPVTGSPQQGCQPPAGGQFNDLSRSQFFFQKGKVGNFTNQKLRINTGLSFISISETQVNVQPLNSWMHF